MVIKFAKTSIGSPFVYDNIEGLSNLREFVIKLIYYNITEE
jgi:hypothetical protein